MSSSSRVAKKLFETLKIGFPDKKIVMVHGKRAEVFILENKCPDNTKKLKTDIITNFTEYGLSCDLLIYTPTITSGVSFNELYFYRIFGYCSNGSKVNRCFLQQLNRI